MGSLLKAGWNTPGRAEAWNNEQARLGRELFPNRNMGALVS